MRDCNPGSPRRAPRVAAWLLVGLLSLTFTGCYYNGHRTFGATEKLAASEVTVIPKTIGVLFSSPVDSLLAPWIMIFDQLRYDPQYDPNHKYISYAGSRVIARSDMEWGYSAIATIFAVPIETVYLLLTGPIDLIWVLGFEEPNDGDDDDDDDDEDEEG